MATESKSGFLSALRLRDTRRDMERSKTYSHIVAILRWVIPAAIAVVLAVVVAWPMVKANKLGSIIAEKIPNLVVENLRLTSIDAENQPYSLTAARALQSGSSKNVIDLELPQGEITPKDGSWLAGKANIGSFDQKNKRLWLSGDIELFHDKGYYITTDEAQFDMDNHMAWGDNDVLIRGDFGEISGRGFQVTERGNLITIKGRAVAKIKISPAGKAPDGKKE